LNYAVGISLRFVETLVLLRYAKSRSADSGVQFSIPFGSPRKKKIWAKILPLSCDAAFALTTGAVRAKG
jgi:hypothetical protein